MFTENRGNTFVRNDQAEPVFVDKLPAFPSVTFAMTCTERLSNELQKNVCV